MAAEDSKVAGKSPGWLYRLIKRTEEPTPSQGSSDTMSVKYQPAISEEIKRYWVWGHSNCKLQAYALFFHAFTSSTCVCATRSTKTSSWIVVVWYIYFLIFRHFISTSGLLKTWRLWLSQQRRKVPHTEFTRTPRSRFHVRSWSSPKFASVTAWGQHRHTFFFCLNVFRIGFENSKIDDNDVSDYFRDFENRPALSGWHR